MALPLTIGPNAHVLALGILSIALAAKHYVADFVLQTEWIARGKERADGWGLPLLVHAGEHAVGTLLIVSLVQLDLWWLALADFVVHGAVDRGKALLSLRLRLPVSNPRFWWLLGFDQFLHHVTNTVLATLTVILSTPQP